MRDEQFAAVLRQVRNIVAAAQGERVSENPFHCSACDVHSVDEEIPTVVGVGSAEYRPIVTCPSDRAELNGRRIGELAQTAGFSIHQEQLHLFRAANGRADYSLITAVVERHERHPVIKGSQLIRPPVFGEPVYLRSAGCRRDKVESFAAPVAGERRGAAYLNKGSNIVVRLGRRRGWRWDSLNGSRGGEAGRHQYH